MYIAFPNSVAKASPISTELRECNTTAYPSLDSLLAIAAPIPHVEPVTRATGNALLESWIKEYVPPFYLNTYTSISCN